MNKDQPASKVLFRVPQEDGTADVETLWATEVGEDLYRIDNTPFFAYSVSWLDVVYAPFDEDEKQATYKEVIKKSGHRTIRIIFDGPVTEEDDNYGKLQEIIELGCSYEGAYGTLVSIDIPPNIDLLMIRNYLIEKKFVFEHADPTYEEIFGDDK